MEEATLMSSWNKHRANCDRSYILPISARHPNALNALARSYAEMLSSVDAPALQDVCYSAAVGRAHHHHRLALLADSGEAMVTALLRFVDEGRTDRGACGKLAAQPPRKPVFVFTGMGPQWWGMGTELFETEPVFKEAARMVDDAF